MFKENNCLHLVYFSTRHQICIWQHSNDVIHHYFKCKTCVGVLEHNCVYSQTYNAKIGTLHYLFVCTRAVRTGQLWSARTDQLCDVMLCGEFPRTSLILLRNTY